VEYFAFSFSGLVVGFLVGLTGVGGGALMTPLLVLVFGFKPAVAVGTDLIFAASTKCFGVWVHGNQGSVDWQVVGRLALGSIPASLLCLFWLHNMGSEGASSQLIMALLGATLIFTGAAMFFRNRLHRIGQEQRTHAPHRFKKWQPHLTVLAGVVLGVLVTLTSIGAGALGAVMLSYLYPFRLSAPKVVGTDLAHAIPLATVAGSGHLMMGHIDYGLLSLLLLGSIPGVYLGSRLTTLVNESYIRYAIAAMLLLVGIKALH
jgi:uncharacterized membrane protein YfcA